VWWFFSAGIKTQRYTGGWVHRWLGCLLSQCIRERTSQNLPGDNSKNSLIAPRACVDRLKRSNSIMNAGFFHITLGIVFMPQVANDLALDTGIAQ